MPRICSIDIGYKNFAIYIEDYEASKTKFTKTKLTIHETIDICKATIDYDECSDLYKSYLIDNVFFKSTPVYFNVLDISIFKDTNDTIVTSTIKMLQSLSIHLDKVDQFLIESQPATLQKGNDIAQIETITCSYMFTVYKKYPRYLGSAVKTKHFTSHISKLDCSVNKKYTERKKFTVAKTCQVLPYFNDSSECIKFIKSIKKKDDICDAILQLQVDKMVNFNLYL